MPVTQDNYNEIEKASKGYLEINADEFYFNKVRPFMQDILLKCKTDKELIRTLEKVINSADSFCIRKDYNALMESFEVIESAITSPNYFDGVMKKAPETEKDMVRQLITKISDLHMIVKCEPPCTSKEEKTKERINYSSPIGENMDYTNHNMKKMTEINPKTRIPNV